MFLIINILLFILIDFKKKKNLLKILIKQF